MRKIATRVHLSKEASDILAETADRTTYTRSIVVDLLLKEFGRQLGVPAEAIEKPKGYHFNG